MLERWLEKHHEVMEQMMIDLELPIELLNFCYDLWLGARLKAPRTPNSLIVDCIYTIAHMTGNRRSFTQMKDASMRVIGRRCEPLHHDRRRKRAGDTRWVETDWGKHLILSLVNDESSYDDLVNGSV
jgi:hypothetical protein